MFHNDFCKGCAYNTNKYAVGCEAYEEMPRRCMNHTSRSEKKERQEVIAAYTNNKEGFNPVNFVRFSGSCGKYTAIA